MMRSAIPATARSTLCALLLLPALAQALPVTIFGGSTASGVDSRVDTASDFDAGGVLPLSSSAALAQIGSASDLLEVSGGPGFLSLSSTLGGALETGDDPGELGSASTASSTVILDVTGDVDYSLERLLEAFDLLGAVVGGTPFGGSLPPVASGVRSRLLRDGPGGQETVFDLELAAALESPFLTITGETDGVLAAGRYTWTTFAQLGGVNTQVQDVGYAATMDVSYALQLGNVVTVPAPAPALLLAAMLLGAARRRPAAG